ncbi:hypothetical protein A8E25_08350 [Burkholderia cenocepacia]|nr:hypothetical protein BURCENK562V_C2109 [Burkholderia cenocepacia K56-2Valvano]ERI28514.1 hypothetical protein BURCENBC7_AP8020 [Burkholderia cenocepacia BC7]ONR53548.1 hypothetical protein A8E17_27320 [Burkholderia cenocepacia]ONR77065.1 hypothetical protein A8E18_07055 [Burkholderia cenocepacia]ONR77453.1 hypothetical protein A8E23_04095 [Burkholderia cenocepacia]
MPRSWAARRAELSVACPPPASVRVTPRSATGFRPLARIRKVAHACRTGLIRENTDPPTTGNP